MTRVCEVCHKNFDSNYSCQKHCGKECRRIATKDRKRKAYAEKCAMGLPVPIGVTSITEENKKALSMGLSYGKMKALEIQKTSKTERAIQVLEERKACALCVNSSDDECFNCKKANGCNAKDMTYAFDLAIALVKGTTDKANTTKNRKEETKC